MSTFRVYGSITKVEEQSDGTLRVEGIASSETKDSQGEIVRASAIEKAIPAYLRKDGSGPLREMHQPIAAGKTTAIDVQPDGTTYIVTKVIDAGAIQKVKEKVLQGFSIGGHVPPGGRNKDDPKIIEQIVLNEISLVDRPANPDAMFTLVKIADVQTSGQVPAAEAKKADAPAAKQATTEAAKTQAEASPAAQGGASATSTQKSMYQVGWCAELVGALASLASSTQFEADFEEDDSEIPARLKALCGELGAILKDLAGEEVDELMTAKGTDAVAILALPGTLKRTEKLAHLARAVLAVAKKTPPELPELSELRKRVTEAEAATVQAGAALVKVTDERNELHQKHADALLALKAKGVAKDPKFVEAAAKAEALETALQDAYGATEQAGEALRKVSAERDELKKQADRLETALDVNARKAKEQLDQVIEQRDALTKQRDEAVSKLAVAEVKLKTKGVLKVVPVEKSADTGAPLVDEGAVPAEGTPARALYEMKKVQRSGGRPLAFGVSPATQESPR